MKIKTVTVTLVRRLSDGDYGTFGSEVTIEAELEEGDKAIKVSNKLRELAEQEVIKNLESMRSIKAAKNKKD